ncbi:hypothetical protein [Curtobacterium sp. PhB146]|uniref:hypothetical protein n=1 Tax=Curtobacterium sp. PhB146 TaxID=2485187 RepID=UPI00104683FF|nr:hypothetical protein [Curtobacterium sp. PhB146]TCU48342.1 hypothetical protein EDF33_102233 [Curtobacterium sp. PhB146]
MTVTAAQLADYVNPDQYGLDGDERPEPDEFTTGCAKRAAELVKAYIGAVTVPGDIIDGAVLEVGSELYHRRKSPNGVAQFGTEGTPSVFTARDPLVRVYPVLDQWVPRGLA